MASRMPTLMEKIRLGSIIQSRPISPSPSGTKSGPGNSGGEDPQSPSPRSRPYGLQRPTRRQSLHHPSHQLGSAGESRRAIPWYHPVKSFRQSSRGQPLRHQQPPPNINGFSRYIQCADLLTVVECNVVINLRLRRFTGYYRQNPMGMLGARTNLRMPQLKVLCCVGEVRADLQGSLLHGQLRHTVPQFFGQLLVVRDPIPHVPAVLKERPDEVIVLRGIPRRRLNPFEPALDALPLIGVPILRSHT